MFGDKGRPIRLIALKSIMSTKMIKRTLVRDHTIHVIALFNKIEILRIETDRDK